MSRNLFTIGYEGTDIKSFISVLHRYSIDCVLDVRELPLSRKRGFSKNVLANFLNNESIDYVHFRELGSPRDLRMALRKTQDYELFFKKMSQFIDKNIDAIRRAHNHVLYQNCCLLCYERSHEHCHRSIVAQKIKEYDGNGLKISNIPIQA